MELDWGVGVIIDTLKQLGIDKNSLVLFSSDNGAAEVDSAFGEQQVYVRLFIVTGSWFVVEDGSNGPFLCGKQTTFEGGVREPTIAWGPGFVSPGKVSTNQFVFMLFTFHTSLHPCTY